MSAAFTPARVEGLRGRIADHVDGYLAPHRGTGRIELVADLAHPLPAVVIAEMAGFPVEDRERFRDWTYRINSFFFQSGTADPVAAEDANAAVVEARTWIHGLLEERRAHPKDDLLTALVAAEYEGGRLTEAELLSTAITLFLGGHDTTTQLIALGMSALVRHPDQLALLRERPDLVPAAVEEMLRYDAPFQMNLRYVTEDVELGGRTLRAGDLVRQALGSGSRDPDRFEEPDAFRIERPPARHLSFGLGHHFCLGAPLARLQAQVAVEALVGQLPGSAPRPRRRTRDRTSGPTSRAAASGRYAWPSTRPEADRAGQDHARSRRRSVGDGDRQGSRDELRDPVQESPQRLEERRRRAGSRSLDRHDPPADRRGPGQLDLPEGASGQGIGDRRPRKQRDTEPALDHPLGRLDVVDLGDAAGYHPGDPE